MMPKFAIGAYAVIIDKKDRILLSHRRDLDIWNLPGCHVEDGELPTEAVIRETKEETGLKIKIKSMVGIYKKSDINRVDFVFLGKRKGGKLKKTKAADKHKFFKYKAIPENTLPKHMERIHDAVREYKKSSVFSAEKHTSSKVLKETKEKENQIDIK
jgi:ADP-ribose pyrophosphatase YjhB (NUDIX family)